MLNVQYPEFFLSSASSSGPTGLKVERSAPSPPSERTSPNDLKASYTSSPGGAMKSGAATEGEHLSLPQLVAGDSTWMASPRGDRGIRPAARSSGARPRHPQNARALMRGRVYSICDTGYAIRYALHVIRYTRKYALRALYPRRCARRAVLHA